MVELRLVNETVSIVPSKARTQASSTRVCPKEFFAELFRDKLTRDELLRRKYISLCFTRFFI